MKYKLPNIQIIVVVGGVIVVLINTILKHIL
jgi:hypothetical protein